MDCFHFTPHSENGRSARFGEIHSCDSEHEPIAKFGHNHLGNMGFRQNLHRGSKSVFKGETARFVSWRYPGCNQWTTARRHASPVIAGYIQRTDGRAAVAGLVEDVGVQKGAVHNSGSRGFV